MTAVQLSGWFDQDGVPCGERVQGLHRGQKERVIAGPDDEDNAEGLAFHGKSVAAQPERPSASPMLFRAQDPGRMRAEESCGLDQGHDFRHHFLCHRPSRNHGRRACQSTGVFR